MLAALGEAFGWPEEHLLAMTIDRLDFWNQALLDLQATRRENP